MALEFGNNANSTPTKLELELGAGAELGKIKERKERKEKIQTLKLQNFSFFKDWTPPTIERYQN